MELHHLVQMANRIAEFFAAMPEPDEAVEGVATHLRKFWEPRMRRQLLVGVEAGLADDLHPLVQQALVRYREMLTPPACLIRPAC